MEVIQINLVKLENLRFNNGSSSSLNPISIVRTNQSLRFYQDFLNVKYLEKYLALNKCWLSLPPPLLSLNLSHSFVLFDFHVTASEHFVSNSTHQVLPPLIIYPFKNLKKKTPVFLICVYVVDTQFLPPRTWTLSFLKKYLFFP